MFDLRQQKGRREVKANARNGPEQDLAGSTQSDDRRREHGRHRDTGLFRSVAGVAGHAEQEAVMNCKNPVSCSFREIRANFRMMDLPTEIARPRSQPATDYREKERRERHPALELKQASRYPKTHK
jgi:hypothetical protein